MYNAPMQGLGIGDVIRRARKERRLTQEALGELAAHVRLRKDDRPINKSTISKIENDPYSSELSTVWRVLVALELSFTEVERRLGGAHPFAVTEMPRKTRILGHHR